MNLEILYQQLDRNIPFIQGMATNLSNDFDVARFLYQETTHQAIKNKKHLREETLKVWLKTTMKSIFSKLNTKR
ncbi:MAG: hypothetical protein AB8F74_03135 [Saprospiraceae bacterium]